MIHKSLIAGLTEAGVTVYDAGLCTTPLVYWATAEYNFPLSIMITASHNPANYNGLKVSRTGAIPVGYDTGLKDLEELIEKELPAVNDKKG
ncbi:MAG TPA: hypothetical protein PKE52_02990, partial [Bacteroidales bacterium]|nr:hypothetical protein [Bacteroidales bacterium]